MAGKKRTVAGPAPSSSAKRNGSVASSSPSSKRGTGKPNKVPASPTAAIERAAPKSGGNEKGKPSTPKKNKRDKAESQDGGKRKKQQASGGGATPPTKRKKKESAEPEPRKQKGDMRGKQQPSGEAEKPAPTSTKKQQKEAAMRESGGAEKATPSKRKRGSAEPQKEAKSEKKGSGRAEKATPSKRKRGDAEPQKEAKSEKRGSGRAEKPTPNKRKRGDAEAQKEVKSEKKGSPAKKRKDKAAVAAGADPGACSFPMSRVRLLMGAEDASIRSTSEAVFLINKASELFLETFAKDAYQNALKERKKSIIYDNISTAVCNLKRYKFLSDFVPQRVTAGDALKATAVDQL